MTREERRKKLESFGRAPALLSDALRQFPKKMWLHKVSQDCWNIHETILHLADSEASAYVRCSRLIAEPGSPALKFDPERWASTLGYLYQSTREALGIICRLRKMTYRLLITVAEPVWLYTAAHPRDGEITLDQWIEQQERHIPRHIEQMRHTYERWLKTHAPRKPASRSATSGALPLVHSVSTGYC